MNDPAASSPAEVLKRARNALSPPGAWLKKKYAQGNQRCLVQAIRDVDGEHADKAITILSQSIVSLFGRGTGSGQSRVISFNDHKATQKMDVLAALDAAVESASKETT